MKLKNPLLRVGKTKTGERGYFYLIKYLQNFTPLNP